MSIPNVILGIIIVKINNNVNLTYFIYKIFQLNLFYAFINALSLCLYIYIAYNVLFFFCVLFLIENNRCFSFIYPCCPRLKQHRLAIT